MRGQGSQSAEPPPALRPPPQTHMSDITGLQPQCPAASGTQQEPGSGGSPTHATLSTSVWASRSFPSPPTFLQQGWQGIHTSSTQCKGEECQAACLGLQLSQTSQSRLGSSSSVSELASSRLGTETHGLCLTRTCCQGLTSKVARGVRTVKNYIGKIVPALRLRLPLHYIVTSSSGNIPHCVEHSRKCDRCHAGLCHPRRCQDQLNLTVRNETGNPAMPSPSLPLFPIGGTSPTAAQAEVKFATGHSLRTINSAAECS